MDAADVLYHPLHSIHGYETASAEARLNTQKVYTITSGMRRSGRTKRIKIITKKCAIHIVSYDHQELILYTDSSLSIMRCIKLLIKELILCAYTSLSIMRCMASSGEFFCSGSSILGSPSLTVTSSEV